jgi:hypothetical protein
MLDVLETLRVAKEHLANTTVNIGLVIGTDKSSTVLDEYLDTRTL